MLGRGPEDPEVLRDIARRCRMIGSAVTGDDRQRILGYARELERVAAERDEVDTDRRSSVSGRRSFR